MFRHWLSTRLHQFGPTLRNVPGRVEDTVRELLPRNIWHWLSVALIWCVFTWFLVSWVQGHSAFLFDPDQQTDDARTSLIGFHQYGANSALGDDPISQEMVEFATPGTWLLYRILVPVTGLYWASKIIQNSCLLLIVGAGTYLALRRRVGLASGLLLIFIALYTAFVKDRINSGLVRAFGFPALFWWIAGAVADRSKPRYFAALLAAPNYPPAMAMVLAAEGLFVFRQPPRWTLRELLARFKRYALLVAACAFLVTPALLSTDDRGHIHTLEEARRNPAFGKTGRLYVLPFEDPAEAIGKHLLAPFYQYGTPALGSFKQKYEPLEHTLALVLFALLLAVSLMGLSPAPKAFVAILCGSALLYLLARLLAFRLYSPVRFLEYAAPAATTALLVTSLGLAAHRVRDPWRAVVRNVAAAAFMTVFLVFVGNGVELEKCCINRRTDAALWDHIRSLPARARIAAHIKDADSIPYWGARANTGGYETIQPWFVGHWKKQEKRAHDTLRALYATDERQISDFVRKYEVTHFMINKARYRADFQSKSRSFEPLSTFAADLLRRISLKDLIFARVRPECITFRHRQFVLVDAAKLLQAERRDPPKP